MMFPSLGKTLIIIGALIMLMGIVITAAGRIPFLGKLPGDFTFKGKNITVYFPLMTGILLSIVLSVLLNIFGRR